MSAPFRPEIRAVVALATSALGTAFPATTATISTPRSQSHNWFACPRWQSYLISRLPGVGLRRGEQPQRAARRRYLARTKGVADPQSPSRVSIGVRRRCAPLTATNPRWWVRECAKIVWRPRRQARHFWHSFTPELPSTAGRSEGRTPRNERGAQGGIRMKKRHTRAGRGASCNPAR